jgi:xylitol oxidase
MKKRTFLKTSSLLVTGSILSPMIGCQDQQNETRKNWAGNYTYSTDKLWEPKTVEEVQTLVKGLDKVRILGTRHSFNSIADSTENQLSLHHLNRVVALDEKSSTVTVEAGVSYGKLSPYLYEKGYALHNLASLPHISIAGACATATHGSGIRNRNLSTAVAAMEIVTAGGEVINLSREKDSEQFQGAVVGLGALGVVTRLTLDIQPAFNVRQDVYLNLPLQQLKDHFGEIMSAGYSVSLFTDWKSEYVNQVWIKRRVEDGASFKAEPEFFGAVLATKNVHPILEISAENCTEQMGASGPWHERLPHFRMNFTPSSGEELQAEYFVPYQHAIEALSAISRLGAEVFPHLLISEVRTIDADDLWMSPCYKQPCVAIHFTLKQDWTSVQKLLPKIEEALSIFNARPHWAKLFTMPPLRLQSLYEKLPDFKKLVKQYDPKEKFRNEFLERSIYGVQ